MRTIDNIIKSLTDFRDARNWSQFHKTKDLAIALSVEAAELNELFLWKSDEQVEQTDRERVAEELADVFAYAFLIAEKFNFDVEKIVKEKILKNGQKYPVEKSRNSARKYNELL